MKLTLLLLILNCSPSFAQIAEPPNVEFPTVEKPEAVETFIFFQCPAKFPGGINSMKQYIQNYHHDGWNDNEKSKRGYVTFIVEADGSLMDIKVVRGISPKLDDLMLRMVEEMPKWTPACDLDGPIRSRVRLPITFARPEE